MKKQLKIILTRCAPSLLEKGRGTWRKYYTRRFERQKGLHILGKKFVAKHDLKVLSGLFQGMKYVPDAVGSAFLPKILGSYGSELHDVLEGLIRKDLSLVVDIGCAERFYVVRLAKVLPKARIYTFDAEMRARTLCNQMDQLNGIENRVFVKGFCQPDNLNKLLVNNEKAPIVCDCEGCEYDLLSLDQVTRLQSAHLLVELHPPCSGPLTTIEEAIQKFLGSFRVAHEVTTIASVPRNPDKYPALEMFSLEERRNDISEWRSSDQVWAYLKPMSGHN